MKIFADENIERRIVEWLRGGGHDVVYAAEVAASVEDAVLLERANAEERVFLTADLDLGELVFRQRLSSCGVILLRIARIRADERLAVLQAAWTKAARGAPGHFVVVTEGRIRVRPLSGQR